MHKKAEFKRNLDKDIALLEEKLAKLKLFRQSLDDPTIDERIDRLLGQEGGSIGLSLAPRALKTTNSIHFSKAKDFFKSRANEWATGREIGAYTALSKSSVKALLYVRHKEYFEKKESPDGINRWRLKPEFAV